MKMKYFIELQRSHPPKNMAQSACYNLFRSFHRVLIDSSSIASFKEHLKQKITEINEAHPRCSTVPFQIYDCPADSPFQSSIITAGDSVSLEVKQVEREINPTQWEQ